MSRRLLLDGEDLHSLMLRVRDEMGPDAKIVKAERIRTGGIAGFFARERYELTVEVPERPGRRLRRPAVGAAGPAPGPGGPAGIDALLAAADAAEAAPALDLAESFEPAAPPEAGEHEPQVSTAGGSFAEVLSSMRQIVGPEHAGPAGAEAAPEPVHEPAARGVVLRQSMVPGDLPRAVALDLSHGSPPVHGEDRLDPAVGVPVDGQVDVPVDLPGPWAEEVVDELHGSSVAALLELGIPTRLLAGFADPHAPVALSQLVRQFDRPPVAHLVPGAVIVVAGPAEIALRTATQMAHRAGLEPTDVVLAGAVEAVPGHGRRLQTEPAVARFRAKVPTDVPCIVMLGVGRGADGWAEASALLEALRPDEAWAAVDARLKPVEQRRWLRAVGARRPFDAVAACGTFEAQAPGTVLNLGVPVGWVDGLPASPVVWAAVLSERMADDARWD